MTRARLFVVVVIASLIAAAAALAPRREERAAMLAGEGRHVEAVAALRRRLADAPGDLDLLAALARSYAALGEADKAIAAFDAYLAARPGDVAALEREAQLLLQGGMTDRALDALARAAAAEPTPARIARLLALYRLHGRDDDELRTLERFGERRALDPAQLERLGALLAERGDWRGAQAPLERADRLAPPEASEGRLLLLDVAMRAGALDAVAPRLPVWVAGWRSRYLSGRLFLRLAAGGRAREASRLAAAYADIAPDDAPEMAEFLAAKGLAGLARPMLRRWSERSDVPDGARLDAFVRTVARLGEPDEGLRKLLRLARGGASPAAVGRLAEDLADAFGAEVRAAVRPLLSLEALESRPLFAAELAEAEGNREAARWHLRRVDPGELRAGKAARWLALCRELGLEPEAKAALARLLAEGRPPEGLLPASARAVARLDTAAAVDLIWTAPAR